MQKSWIRALAQSGWQKGLVTESKWPAYVLERLATLKWQRVVDDVQRFVIDQQDLTDFKKETIEHLLT